MTYGTQLQELIDQAHALLNTLDEPTTGLLSQLEMQVAQAEAVTASKTINKADGAQLIPLKLYTANDQPLPEALTVQVQAGGGSAQPGVHYTFAPASITFAAGSTNGSVQEVTLTPIPGAILSDKTAILTLNPGKLGMLALTTINIDADPVCISPITFDIPVCYELGVYSSGFGQSVLDTTAVLPLH
ncbi:MAG: hypothetical protein SGI73_00755 [Chloroflexota bacterium]|nr:hypothetical protein [Chloroflexota bacterium]